MTYQPQPLTDAEVERHIEDCGAHFLKAYAEGDKALAREWLTRQAEAIKLRSPATVARMEACYFCAEGERSRRAAQVRAVS